MKGIKRALACMLMAMAMAFGMAGVAFADPEGTLGGGQITIDNAVVGQNYNIYQILYLESYSDEDGDGEDAGDAYSYKANSAWKAWLKTQDKYVNIDEQGYVTWVAEGEDAAKAFAAAARAYAKDNPETIKADISKKADTTTVTFGDPDLKLGYYLVESTLGVLCSLDTTNPTVVMKEKNSIPDITKKVQENSTGDWGKTNDASIGDTVNFRSTIEAQPNSLDYVMHDKMSAGLTLVADSISIAGLTEGTHYTVEIASADKSICEDGCDFHIVFDNAYLATLEAETDIVVTYSAVLNSNAVIAGAGNPNDVKLVYGNESKTEWRRTVTYTWGMGVLKYANGVEADTLAGAKFVLLNAAGNKVATVVDGEMTGWVDVPVASEGAAIVWPANTELMTDDKGEINIAGLDAGAYNLRETAAPVGYNKLNGDVEVEIAAGDIGDDGIVVGYAPTLAKVNNQSGAELPSTGGMGTTIIYAVGAMLIIASAVLLVVRRRTADGDK